ncbi:hypothetical protein FIBSPDRAFT_424693 [Athelia psychrophila]|uniref:Major facilitator superfamily (MFS) profile domain-containing protein n=1 Tax=Athelia psychrophila TaxID=1759441 RepID=A0A167UPY0_9AGAM|nr:hypothetical protein FIBSPDRAFT_424693 [Fibularhizoctonia sp. CBS 109695]
MDAVGSVLGWASTLSHGSQDLYPTYLKSNEGLPWHDATVATIISNIGAFAGYISQYIGRRLTLISSACSSWCLSPLDRPSTFSALSTGAFCIQFEVQGAGSVIPTQFAEMTPPAFRPS